MGRTPTSFPLLRGKKKTSMFFSKREDDLPFPVYVLRDDEDPMDVGGVLPDTREVVSIPPSSRRLDVT